MGELVKAIEHVAGTGTTGTGTGAGAGAGAGADALAEITHGGLTFFAAVDDAWTEEAWTQVMTEGVGARVLGNHVSWAARHGRVRWRWRGRAFLANDVSVHEQ